MALKSFDDKIQVEGKAFSQVVRYKARKGQEDQIRIVESKISVFFLHYVETTGRYYRCCKEQYDRCPLCDRGIPRGQKFGVNIIHWNDNARVKLWQFGPDKYTQIRGLSDKYKEKAAFGPINQYDLCIKCGSKGDDEQFQKVQIIAETKEDSHEVTKEIFDRYVKERFDIEALNKLLTPEELETELALNVNPEASNEEQTSNSSDNSPESVVGGQSVEDEASSAQSFNVDQALHELDS